MIGERLKTTRISAGLSLRDLQAKIGNSVSAQAIGKYERGEMRPAPEILKLLADALEVSEKYLTEIQEIQLEKIEFRENFIRSKKEEAQVEATILKYIERYLEIEELLQVNTTEWERPREFPFLVRDLKEAEWAAHKVRDDWKLGNDPILNLSEFFEDRGIKVISLPLPNSIAGVTCFVHRKNSQKIPTILINTEITGERQRFTLAHELGHLVLENKSQKSMEKICDRFAGAFLIPDRILWATLGRHRQHVSIGELRSIKKFFAVSIQAIVYRCKDLDIITYQAYQNLYKEFKERGWLTPPYSEPEPIPSEETQRFKRLCFRALTEGVISTDKAANLLNKTIEQITSELNSNNVT